MLRRAARRDRWTTTYGDGAGLILYAVVREQRRLPSGESFVDAAEQAVLKAGDAVTDMS